MGQEKNYVHYDSKKVRELNDACEDSKLRWVRLEPKGQVKNVYTDYDEINNKIGINKKDVVDLCFDLWYSLSLHLLNFPKLYIICIVNEVNDNWYGPKIYIYIYITNYRVLLDTRRIS